MIEETKLPVFQFSESEERIAMKQLFKYVYSRALGKSRVVQHRHESGWEQVCRFLYRFDPEGRTQLGYTPQKKLLEIYEHIDSRDLKSLPCIETFLAVSLTLSDYFCPIGDDDFHSPLRFDPDLEPILKTLGLIDENGVSATPLVINALDSFQFFDPEKRELVPGAKEFLEQVAENAWFSASRTHKSVLASALQDEAKPSFDLPTWLSDHWRFGEWLTDEDREKDRDLFHAHSAIGWFMSESIRKALAEGRLKPH